MKKRHVFHPFALASILALSLGACGAEEVAPTNSDDPMLNEGIAQESGKQLLLEDDYTPSTSDAQPEENSDSSTEETQTDDTEPTSDETDSDDTASQADAPATREEIAARNQGTGTSSNTQDTANNTANTSSADTSSADTSSASDETSDAQEGDVLGFDWVDALQNIYIDEQKTSLPYAITDLGADYHFAPIGASYGDGIAYYNVQNADGLQFDAVYFADDVQDKTEYSKIDLLKLGGGHLDHRTENGIYDFRVGRPATKADLMAVFGEPQSQTRTTLSYSANDYALIFHLNDAMDTLEDLWILQDSAETFDQLEADEALHEAMYYGTSGGMVIAPKDGEHIITKTTPGELQFDWDEAMQHLYLGETRVDYPETLEALGGQYAYGGEGSVSIALEVSGVAAEKISARIMDEVDDRKQTISYHEVPLCDALVVAAEDGTITETSAILGIVFDIDPEVEVPGGIYQFRAGQEVARDEILAFFGRETWQNEFAISYDVADGQSLTFSFDYKDGSTLKSITIGNIGR